MLPARDADVALALIRRPARPARRELEPEALGRLADDMAANGLLQRVGLRGPFPDGSYEIAWGDRRCAAARLLLWPAIAAKVYAPDADPLGVRAAENFQREQLTPLEEAEVVRELHEAGHPLAGIARLLRRSDAWVRSRLDLLHYPEDVRQAVHAGQLSLAVAELLARVDHDDYRASLLGEADRTGANQRTAQVWLAHYEADKARIVSNHLTVQEITSARDAYVIYYKCDACRQEVDYRETRSWRFCAACGGELQRGLAAAAQGEAQRSTT